MNTEQIIKALKCCRRENCIGCPYRWKCHQGNPMHGDALALIEKLKAQNETLEIYNKDYKYRNKELQEANEGLAKNCEELEIVGDELREWIENLKKENKYLRERLAEEAEIKEDMKGK